MAHSMKLLQIGEIAQLLGITTKTIRHYHKLGLLPEPQRADNGYRLYQIDDLMRLQKIMSLQKLGLSLKQIQFIFSAPDPDAILQMLMQQRREAIDDEMTRLKRQRQQIDGILQQDDANVLDVATQPDSVTVSSSQVIYHAISPHASGLADVILAIESESLHQLDTYQWSEGYDKFWHNTVQNQLQWVMPHEHDVILWLERYLALGDLAPDDLQARTWLEDMRYHPFRLVLSRMLFSHATGILPDKEAQQALQLTSLLLYTQANSLQKRFLSLLVNPS